MQLSPSHIRIDSLKNLYHTEMVEVDVLRLDLIHPTVSGNKWFKLKEYLTQVKAQGKKTILTFGGAFSNHIIASAAACKEFGLKSIGIIRGEEPTKPSDTIIEARELGMKLYFISRTDYTEKKIPTEVWEAFSREEVYIINEGGYGIEGRRGAEEILSLVDKVAYSHIIAACGTGTTMAGLITASLPNQEVIGIPVLKNLLSLKDEINALLPPEKHSLYKLIDGYQFGGYAKHTVELLGFMNSWYQETNIPSDFVYTGKLFYAVDDLIKKGYFPKGSKMLVIHSGGLQGNRSLPEGTLIF